MKAVSNNYIGYQGDVTITLRNKKRNVKRVLRAHNEGTYYLFNAIAKALAGYNISDELPGYIDITTDNTNESLLNNRLRITGRVYGSAAFAGLQDTSRYDNKGVVLVNAILTNGSKKAAESNTVKLVLYNEANNQQLATLEDSRLPEMFRNVNDNNDALIEWRLVISDAPAQTNQQGE